MLNDADLWVRGAGKWQPAPALVRGKQAWAQPTPPGAAAVVKVQGALDTDIGTALRLLLARPCDATGSGGLGGSVALVEALSDFSDVVRWLPGEGGDFCLLRQWCVAAVPPCAGFTFDPFMPPELSLCFTALVLTPRSQPPPFFFLWRGSFAGG